ncbi:cell division cycle-associated protein 3 [Thalassophryne amazonica]|uniref:cell division cycle-associated protein 3 n=1 Tax=Thalassophryne amazonica TaxID=390379 RepID=UPI00147133DB|nr:cell division cycle-associated protein 3 [Thalassophryne amazonica]
MVYDISIPDTRQINMGSSESKMTTSSSSMKQNQMMKTSPVDRLMDPRSPSAGIDRTPIQVGLVSKTSGLKNESLASSDPRSPTVGITRTPVREIVRATVDSFARRLGVRFHSEAEDKAPAHTQDNVGEEEVVFRVEEMPSTEPLLVQPPSRALSSLAEHANLLATPVSTPLRAVGNSSPFVLLEDPLAQGEMDVSVEAAEEATESPLHKRLSMSLITCHEGTPSSQVFAEVHLAPAPLPDEVEPLDDCVDQSCAPVSLHSDSLSTTAPIQSPLSPTADCATGTSPAQAEDAVKMSPFGDEDPAVGVESLHSSVPNLEQLQPSTGVRCLTIDSKSPSQLVFQPQWLAKGFGSSGLRARGMQAHSGKGGSSPLAVHVAVKNASNENKGQPAKLKQKGAPLSEVRSPLQILKETNSPREQRPQMKLKSSTPDRQKLGRMDHRVLTVALDKENI